MKLHLMALLAVVLPLPAAMSAPPKQPASQLRVAQHQGPPEIIQHEGAYDPAPPPPHEFFDEGGHESCCSGESCDGGGCDSCCRNYGRLSAGFAFVLVQPHREDDLAFTRTRDNGVFTGITDANFDQDTELSPRVWLEYGRTNGLGGRVTYWQFDHGSAVITGTPSAAFFQNLQTPAFRGPAFNAFTLNTATPGERLSAQSNIDFDVLDFEGTKWTDFCCWRLGTTAGLRHVDLSQGYRALRQNVAGAAAGLLNATHDFDGCGPTFSVEGHRAFGRLTFFSSARGSLLFGDGSLSITRVEDFDTAIPLTSQLDLNRNDLVTVGEIQVGMEWHREFCNGGMFFVRSSIEGQVWQGVGSALNEDGDLGFFGLNIALGMSL